MLSETTIGKFKANLRGELIQRSDERYEEARKLYNGMIDKRPLLIAHCVDVADLDRFPPFPLLSAGKSIPSGAYNKHFRLQ